jgi:transcription elongation GreA/GreB family factor
MVSSSADDEVEPYLATWSAAARAILLDAARRYRAVVCYGDLGARVEAKSGIRGPGYWHWMRRTLHLVAQECSGRGEPLLSSLCVNDDSTVVAVFAESIRDLLDVQPGDIELYAAHERLKCYQLFDAVGLPPDGGAPVMAEHCLTGRPTEAEQVRAGVEDRQRRAEAAKHRAKELRFERNEVQRRRRESKRQAEAAKRFRIALPGSVVKVYFDGDEADTATFVIADRLVISAADFEVLSPSSALGNALIEAREGETRTYIGPEGDTFNVTLVSTRPYNGYPF